MKIRSIIPNTPTEYLTDDEWNFFAERLRAVEAELFPRVKALDLKLRGDAKWPAIRLVRRAGMIRELVSIVLYPSSHPMRDEMWFIYIERQHFGYLSGWKACDFKEVSKISARDMGNPGHVAGQMIDAMRNFDALIMQPK